MSPTCFMPVVHSNKHKSCPRQSSPEAKAMYGWVLLQPSTNTSQKRNEAATSKNLAKGAPLSCRRMFRCSKETESLKNLGLQMCSIVSPWCHRPAKKASHLLHQPGRDNDSTLRCRQNHKDISLLHSALAWNINVKGTVTKHYTIWHYLRCHTIYALWLILIICAVHCRSDLQMWCVLCVCGRNNVFRFPQLHGCKMLKYVQVWIPDRKMWHTWSRQEDLEGKGFCCTTHQKKLQIFPHATACKTTNITTYGRSMLSQKGVYNWYKSERLKTWMNSSAPTCLFMRLKTVVIFLIICSVPLLPTNQMQKQTHAEHQN